MNNKQQVLPPAERIAAMRRQFEERQRIEEEQRQAKEQRIREVGKLMGSLHQELKAMDGLPVRARGRECKVEVGFANDGYSEQTSTWLSAVLRTNKGSHVQRLVEFTIVHRNGKAVVIHDDSEVSPDVALDIATAVVEAAFDDGTPKADDAEEDTFVPF